MSCESVSMNHKFAKTRCKHARAARSLYACIPVNAFKIIIAMIYAVNNALLCTRILDVVRYETARQIVQARSVKRRCVRE